MSRLQTKLVPPDGPLDSSICFIGEAPGATEDVQGRPFVGSAGQFFNRCLAAVGLLRNQVLITNVFLQRPPRNDVGYYYQDKKRSRLTWEGEDHVEQLRKWLQRLLESSPKPNLLVALGDRAMYHLTGKEGITKYRGSLLPCTLVPGFKVYATYHPSFVMRLINEPIESQQGEKKRQQQNAYALFMLDLKRIIEQSSFPELKYPERQFDIMLTFPELIGKLRTLENEPLVAVDIETIPRPDGPILWCVGFSPRPDYAFVVPFLKGLRFAWSLEQEAELWQEISKVFLNPKINKIFQGGSYDLSVLGRYYSIRCANNSYVDTMLCHHATYPYIPKALHVQTSIYTWEPYYKDEGRVNFGARTDKSEFSYNAKDCCVTREIYPVVTRLARESETMEGYERSLSVMPSLLAMMLRGVKIDLKKKDKLKEEFTKRAEEARQLLQEATDSDWNPGSSGQMQVLLYSSRADGGLGLQPQHNTKTGRPTVDHDALMKLKRKNPHIKLLDYILDHRKFSKLATTYADMTVDVDGRIHTSYGFVSTWRLSSSESPFGSGGNLQNIPVRSEEGKLIRSLFIPDKNKVMLAADLSQAEARIVAWEAGDERQMKLFQEGWDVHWANSKGLFSLPEDATYIPKAKYNDPITGQELTFKEMRQIGKTVVHASNYGMGWMKLQAILLSSGFHFEAAVCKRLLGRHHANNPFISAWQQAIRDQIKSTRVLISAIGRKRTFLGRMNDSLFRSAYAFSPQNTVGELLELSIQAIHSELPYIDILLNVHDEVVMQLDPRDVKKALPEIKQRMELPLEVPDRAMPTIKRKLVIPCDFKIGWNWGQMTESIDDFLKENKI